MRNNWLLKLFAVFLAFSLVAAACGDDDDDGGTAATDDAASADDGSGDDGSGDDGSGDDGSGDDGSGDDGSAAPASDVTISYWLWDTNQEPLYQECANQFTSETGIGVDITQFGWGEYWDGLTAGFATGDVPDVFTDHLARYPEFIDAGILVPLNDYIEADGTPTDIYFEGLADLWVAPDGSRYGLPKDFDTVALVANQDMLDAAGVTAEEIAAATWNPDDGGEFEQIIAKLSIDADGNTGDSADFDSGNVVQYGFTSQNTYADAFGQTGFSIFTGSNGWDFLDQNPWGSVYNYGDSEFTDVVEWMAGLVEKGYLPPSDLLSGSTSDVLMADGAVAMMPDGSWKIGTWSDPESGVANATFIPTPVGPSGQRASMFNGLADSITVASENPDEAWEWVKFMASPTCQEIVGAGGAVFPAISSGTELAVAAFAERGVDVTPFTVHVDEGTTFKFPIAGQASEVTRIMGTAIDTVMRGEGDVSVIAEANAEVNELLAG